MWVVSMRHLLEFSPLQALVHRRMIHRWPSGEVLQKGAPVLESDPHEQENISLHSCLRGPLRCCIEKGLANGVVNCPLRKKPFAESPPMLGLRQRGKPNLRLVPFQNRQREPAPGALGTHVAARSCYPHDPGGVAMAGLSVFLRLERSPSVSLGRLRSP